MTKRIDPEIPPESKAPASEFPAKCKTSVGGTLDCEGRVLLRSIWVESDFNTFLMVPRDVFLADLDQVSTSLSLTELLNSFSMGPWYGKEGSLGHAFEKLLEDWEHIGHNSREYHLSAYANISLFFQGCRDSEDEDDDD